MDFDTKLVNIFTTLMFTKNVANRINNNFQKIY